MKLPFAGVRWVRKVRPFSTASMSLMTQIFEVGLLWISVLVNMAPMDSVVVFIERHTSGAQLTVISSLNWLTSLSATTKTTLYSRSSGLPATSIGGLST